MWEGKQNILCWEADGGVVGEGRCATISRRSWPSDLPCAETKTSGVKGRRF